MVLTIRGLARAGLLALGLAVAAGAAAQTAPTPEVQPLPTVSPAEAPPVPPGEARVSGWIETGLNYHVLTGTEPNWFGQYLRGVVDVAHKDVWSYEIVHQDEHGDDGVFFGLGNTHTFDPDWYTAVSLGTSAGGFFYPRFRADAFVNRKWLEGRNLVTTLGVGYFDAKDVHYDVSFFAGVAYYFTAPWIVEGGLRYNLSYPGAVAAPAPFLAVTYGRNKEHYVTLRAGIGREAYQLVGPSQALVDFQSEVVTLTWRQWLTQEWGFRVSAEYYNNPFYERHGVEIGVFRDF
jgi:YaiO family outer membrane protein